MPQCPHCQAPYEPGQRYCGTCGSYLLNPEEGDTFCPQCGVRVSPRQEYCHECDAPLRGAAAAREVLGPEPETGSPPGALPPVERSGSPRWFIGLLVGVGIIILILLILLFSRGTTPPSAPPPASKSETPAPAPPPTTPSTPAAPAPDKSSTIGPDLKEQLQYVLSTLREAQMHKDIVKFMSVYSLTYPHLDAKRADTSKSWENFDFTNLVFTVDKVQPLNEENTMAWITWYIDAKNRRTQDLTSYSQTYQVRFVKEMEKWRILSLEEVEQ